MYLKFLLDNAMFVVAALASGGMLLWPLIRNRGVASVSPAQATTLINRQDAVIFDVRDSGDYANGRILNARNVPLAHLESRVGDLNRFKDKPIIICDEDGAKCAQALAALRKHGFNNVTALAGGLNGWRQAGLPTEK